jgi:hypothetical protein
MTLFLGWWSSSGASYPSVMKQSNEKSRRNGGL